jgi:tetratricopeptide (TPR) repeat protein
MLMAEAYRTSGTEPDPAEVLRWAIEYHRQGRLEEAERHYRAVLDAAPGQPDALHYLGVLLHQRGHSAEALDCVAAALASNPTSAEILANYGFMLEALGRTADALAAYDRALIVHPNDIDMLFNRGNAQIRLGRFQQAIKSFEDVLALKPDHVGALNNLGTALRSLGRREAALARFGEALALKPDDLIALNNNGTALQDFDHHTEALACFDKALAIDAHQVDIICNRGHSQRVLGLAAEALASFGAALAIDPRHVPSLCNRGNALRDLKRTEEALASFDAALALQPRYKDALCGRGNVLADTARYADAIASYDHALAIDPNFAAAHNGRGLVLTQLQRYDEALSSLTTATARAPENAEFAFREGVARLSAGDFTLGWPKYEARLKLRRALPARKFDSERWDGKTSLRGRTILLHAERDVGDTLRFARYVGPLAAAGARVVTEVQPELVDLMTGVDNVAVVIADGGVAPAHEFHCPLPSLPFAFGTTLNSVPATVPYLRPPPQRVQAWTNCLLSTKPPRVGFAWTSDAGEKSGCSIDLEQLLPSLRHASARFVSLQPKIARNDAVLLAREPSVAPLSAELRGFIDLAAVISLLDLVITVDGATAHLAGALGKPTWILLPFQADFRWMRERSDSPWYPTARLFRQSSAGDWSSVCASIAEALATRRF